MANGDQAQGGQQTGGGRTYSEEDVMTLMNEAARRAAAEAVKNVKHEEDDDEPEVNVINPKVVKQLKDTVAVFTALKELSSNPLQKTIEETVGGMAAAVVQNAFAPRGPPPKKDIVDTILNSQFAYGLGSGLGQRAPELVETMGKTFGSERAGDMVENIIGKHSGQSGSGGQSRQLSSGPSGPSNSSPQSEQKADRQSEKELLLSLDPNNPEHVSAYAETQGGLPVDIARKMLMIHQDAFIEQMKKEGMNVDQINTQRGSHAQPQPSQPAVPLQQNPPIQPPPQHPTMRPDVPMEQPPIQSPDDAQYAEYHDLTQPVPPTSVNNPVGTPPSAPISNQDSQQVEMMKTFASDIGKVMGEMLNRIESLNNTVFTLQNDINTMKKEGIASSQPVPSHEIPSGVPPGMASIVRGIVPIVPIPPTIAVKSTPTEKLPIGTLDESVFETFEEPIIEDIKEPLDTFEKSITEDIIKMSEPKIKMLKSSEFFEENVQDKSEFLKELEEESNINIKKRQAQLPQTSVVSEQPFPPSVAKPIAQAVQPPPVAISSTETVTHPASSLLEQTSQPITQPSQTPLSNPLLVIKQTPLSIIESKQSIIPKASQEEEIQESKSENIDVKDLNNIPIIPDNKNINDKNIIDKNTDKFVTPIKKVGIHKKADTYKNVSPSFKKSDQENKEDTNIENK